jgi:hypothetical protein
MVKPKILVIEGRASGKLLGYEGSSLRNGNLLTWEQTLASSTWCYFCRHEQCKSYGSIEDFTGISKEGLGVAGSLPGRCENKAIATMETQ